MAWYPRLDDIVDWLEKDRWQSLAGYLKRALVLGGRTGGQGIVSDSGVATDAYLGVGTAAPTQLIDAVSSANGIAMIRLKAESTGTTAEARFRAAGDVSRVELTAVSSGYASFAYFGLTPASWTFLATGAGNGLGIGTLNNTPVVFGQNNVERLRLTGNALMFGATAGIFWGTGTPEGAVAAGIGSVFHRTNGGAGTSLYVKESGTGNTGWVGK